MNRFWKETLGACGRMLLELVMFFPVFFLFALALMGDTPMLWIFLGELCFAGLFGVLTRRFIPSPGVQLGLGLPVCIALIILLGRICGGAWPNAYILPVLLTPFVFYRGKQHAQSAWDTILPGYILFALLVIQFVVLALARLNGVIQPYMTLMYISVPVGYISAFIVLNRLNLINLIDEAQSRTSASSLAVADGMRTQNRLLLAILLIIGVALSLGTVLYTAANWILDKIVWALTALFKLLFEFDVGLGQGGGKSQEEGIPEALPLEPGDMSFWGPVFTVISYIGVAVVFIALVVLLYKFVRQLIRIISGVIAKFSDQEIEGTGGGALFEDTRESLVDLSQLPKLYAQSAKERLAGIFRREPGWDDMPTPAEKLKYLYRKVLKKAGSAGYVHRASYTPHEAAGAAGKAMPALASGTQALADKYDALRYGAQEPDAAALDALHHTLGDL